MTDYLRLAQQSALPQQDDAGDNPYLSIAREQQALQQRRARTIIETALKDDPELAAERQRLSQTSGLPLRVIERNFEEVRIKERAKAIDLVRMANESPVLYRQLTDPTFTTTAIDDLGTLEKIERAVGKTAAYVMGADGRGGLPADLGGAAKTVGLGATVGVGKMIFDVAGVVNDLIGWDSGAAAARNQAKRAQEVMDAYGFEGGTSTRDAIRSGLQSAGTNLALLPVGLARNLWTTANQAASAVAGLMSVGVGADAFNRAREQGRSELQAGIYAIPEAAFEFVFERIPASKLFGDIAADETLLRMLGKQMFSEGWTEQVTTLAQDFNEWMNLNQDKTLADYIAERPEAAYQTFVATLVGVGVQTSTIKSIDKIIEKASQQKLQFELDQFNEQLALASQSMLRQRSPEQFRALVQRIVDENTDAKKEIYVDGQVLNQLPADVLAQLPEAVREQIPEAAATNSVVAIPMADVLTIAPGTPLEQILNDNARMTPESLSRVEAQQASEQAQEFLKQEAERVLAQAADQAAWQQSANTVKQKILDQLNQAGRFTSDVNEAYATLQAHFFSSMAARLGITPAELYQRYALKVAAQSPGGQVLDAPIAVYDQGEVTVTDQVDERTGLPLNSDGTVTLYHHTSAANAEAIKKSGMLKSAGEPDVYLTTREIPDTGYGDTVVRVRIDPAKLQLDDEFPDGRKDFRVHVGRPGGALRDAQFDQAPTGRPNYQTTYTDPQGETYEIRLTQEVFGVGDGRELTVQVGAFQNGQRRARVDFELQGNTLAAGNTVVAPAYRRRGLAEAMYRAAREAGYDIMPGRKQTADGERLVARLREKGVINRGTFDPANPNILKQGPRGTFDPKQLLITLNENADLSTFLHESGHFFLEVLADLASQPNAPQQIVDDMATILKWFGIKGDEQVGGSDSGAPLAQQDAEAVSEAIYKEMAADDELVAALEAWMVDGTQPDAATNEKLLGYMRRMPPVPRDSYLTFYRGQPRGAAPHSRGWASWTTNPDTTRFFTEGDSEVLQRKGVQGISLEQIALWRTRLTGELTDYGSQGEWLVLNESVFAQGGDLPTDTTKPAGRTPLEVWNAMTLDQKRPYHERWAESFEQYLFEGKAPSQELQPLFRRFRSWLINVYKSLKQFMLGRNLQVSDDIRKVFDRMIATDEEIAQAEEAAGMLPDFEATNEAIEKLQARSLRDLKWAVNARNKTIKALQKQAAKLRKEVEAEVRAEVEQLPVYRAIRWLKKGETVDPETGDLVKAEKGYRLSTDSLAEMYPETTLARPDLTRLRGMTAKNGLHPDLVADMFGFASGDALVRAIIDAAPISEVIEGMTDQRMLERHGDLATPEAIEEAANEAVHNEARARALATELKAQTEMLNPRQATGRTASNGRPIAVNAITEAAKQFAQNLAARRRVKDLRNAAHQHRAAEARAAKRWQQATAKGDTQAAVQAKRDQLLNNYAAKALQDAQAEAKKILEFFRKVTKGNNEKIVERGRDPDVVNAMRAILAAYGVAPRLEKSALEYMEVVAKNDPAMYAALKPSVDAALFNAKPLDELTMEELRGLNDELRAMWDLAKRSRQMEVDGNLLDIEDAADELVKRMEEIGIPAEIPGERGAITDREEAGIKLQYAKAFLSRVEQWAERMDGKFGGPFLRLVFQPIKEAADRYRTARVDYRKRFTALVENIAPILRPGPIEAPELNYTFGNARDSGQAELLHAILHTGNESNRRKLLLGRGWATELEDGTLDTSRWDAFIARMINEGKITKAHYDFAQGVWDLLEEMKPLAQETHRKVFGRYFAEVTATPFDTPFGSYRGGYVPAQTDPRMVKDAKLRELAEAENESMAYAFPASPSGFTKSRVEYNKPLLLDLRALAQHIDKVLLFGYMQGPVTDVRRLLTNKRVSYALDRIDPGAYEGMLIPWLNRAAKQIVETPVAGDRKLSRFLSAVRSRAGMALMFANLSNTFQQITGFSLAAVKVKPSLMMKATASFIADPKAMKEQVATASEFMRNRMLNEVAAMNDAVEQILINATKLEKAKDWTQRHAYFLQVAVDNTMSPIIWTAAYNQAIEQKMGHKDAVRFADGVIRQTQGTSLPEDISRFESGPAPLRLFTQFIGYFNMMANTNATAMKQIVDEMGLRKGAGKLLYVALAGLLVPIWVAEAIALAFRGGPDDEDDDGYLDDWLMAVFGVGTLRGMVAQVPIVGQAAQLAVNRFNDNPADDKFSLSPAVSLLESAVSSPASVYKAIVDEGSAQKAARDVASAATLITGLPIYAAARPIGYLAGMADERIEPTGPVDLARGLVTGAASPESKVP